MSNEIERKMEGIPKRPSRPARLILKYFWQMLRHNLGWKILALFLAVLLWAGLITQDPTLAREKTFTDVQVNVLGADTLKRNGFIVVDNLSTPPVVRLRVDVPQTEYNNVSASNYNVRIDLSRITAPGTQEIKIVGTSSSTYGTVMEITPDTMQVNVEAYITRYRIPVTVVREGDPPEGFYSTAPTQDPPVVTVSGPASLVNSVARAVATFDQSTLPPREGLVRTGVPFVLVNAYGDEVKGNLLQVTSESVLLDSVVVEQTLYATRTIDLSQASIATGTPASGYQVESITVSPTQIMAAGRAEELGVLDNLFLESPVNVSGAKESFSTVIKVRKPSEIEYLSSDSVTVTVQIEPMQSDRSFSNLPISLSAVPDGLTAKLNKTNAGVTLHGPKLWVDGLKSFNVAITVDASGLSEGIYDVPLLCTVTGSDGIAYTYATNPQTIQLELKKK